MPSKSRREKGAKKRSGRNWLPGWDSGMRRRVRAGHGRLLDQTMERSLATQHELGAVQQAPQDLGIGRFAARRRSFCSFTCCEQELQLFRRAACASGPPGRAFRSSLPAAETALRRRPAACGCFQAGRVGRQLAVHQHQGLRNAPFVIGRAIRWPTSFMRATNWSRSPLNRGPLSALAIGRLRACSSESNTCSGSSVLSGRCDEAVGFARRIGRDATADRPCSCRCR